MSEKQQENSSRPPFNRLDFFKSFIASTGDSQEKIAAIVGVSKVQLRNWFQTDNIKLEHVDAILTHYGYCLDIVMTRKPSPYETEVPINSRNYKMNEGRMAVKRMTFLSLALREIGMTQQELADKLGISKYTVTMWFKNDGITLARIYDIACTCGLNLFLTVRPAEESKPIARDQIRFSSEVILRSDHAVDIKEQQ